MLTAAAAKVDLKVEVLPFPVLEWPDGRWATAYFVGMTGEGYASYQIEVWWNEYAEADAGLAAYARVLYELLIYVGILSEGIDTFREEESPGDNGLWDGLEATILDPDRIL